MKVLALCSYPPEAAATRFRLLQLAPGAGAPWIELEVRPFLDAAAFARLYDRRAWASTSGRLVGAGIRRLEDAFQARSADLIMVQREAMLFGPPIVEWLISVVARVPMILDLDDATWISYRSPTYGRLGQLLKAPGKTDRLIRRAAVVTCGSRAIAEHVERLGATARVVPTVVDTEVFVPAARPIEPARLPTLGWIGSHSTYPYLADLFPALSDLAAATPFRLVVVGAGRPVPPIRGAVVEHREWRLDDEVGDFQSLDIGLYPIGADEWATGKSGLKAIEYMAVGIPFVASPIGAAAVLGEPGVTHLIARTPDQWRDALASLIADPARRQEMGQAGRRLVLGKFTVDHAAEQLAGALFEAAGERRSYRVHVSPRQERTLRP